jgi:hypothetical protein
MLGLAAIGLPRVILHDLHIIDSANPLSAILALGPVAIWVAVAVVRKIDRPFLTVFTIGLMFSVLLVLTHQVLWGSIYAGNPDFLGSGPASEIVLRLAVLPGGLFAGAALGALGGLIAWAIQRGLERKRPQE